MASEATENKAEASGGSAGAQSSGGAGGGGGSKMLPLLTVLNLLVTVAMLALMFIHFNREQKKPAIEDLASGESKGHEGGATAGAAGEHGASAGAEHGAAGGEKKVTEFGRMVNLEQFTVNLATPGSVNPKFVRVNVSIEVPTTDAEGEVNSKMPQVRNTIIDLFNSKKPGDLATVEGRDYLKEEIKNALNGFMVTGKVKGVFFTNFALSS
jgi:flagellar FliL protein